LPNFYEFLYGWDVYKQLRFGDDPDHAAYTGNFTRVFYHCEIPAIVRILFTTPEVVKQAEIRELLRLKPVSLIISEGRLR